MNLLKNISNGTELEWTSSTFGYLSIPTFIMGIVI